MDVLRVYFVISLYFLLVSFSNQNTVSKRYEKVLLDDLLTNYSAYYRPTISNMESVTVKFEWKLVKLVKIDIKAQTMVIDSKILMQWTDPQLSWDSKKYNGTENIIVPHSLIWNPDIMLSNTAKTASESTSDVFKAGARVTASGEVTWDSPVTLLASCSINIKWFPFDSQECSLKFSSVAYTKSKLNIVFLKKPGETSDLLNTVYYSSGDWELTDQSSSLYDRTLTCCPESFSMIEYKLSLKRLYTYYMMYLILPCLCLIWLAPCMFIIPPDSGERSGFGVTVVLSLSVYLLVISDKLPETSNNTPLIGVLYTVMFFLLGLALLAGIVVTNLVFKKTKPPKWIWHLLIKGKVRDRTSINTLETTGDSENKEAVSLSSIRRPSAVGSILPAAEQEESNQEKWRAIGAKIDKILLCLYFVLALVAPTIVYLSFYLSD